MSEKEYSVEAIFEGTTPKGTAHSCFASVYVELYTMLSSCGYLEDPCDHIKRLNLDDPEEGETRMAKQVQFTVEILTEAQATHVKEFMEYNVAHYCTVVVKIVET